ncbi:hypothetical protein R69619_03742 [Paraburkholderia nemoris]|uniref:hypothetical protein n=1 Tax=Paraburkholderia nemoris TaxID=2793076 RepID=UPI00190A17C1|nr:hypothetical protein [Paraburkholderia nemoris]MBK3743154.1 hypothetical protein [Paraburkholderia aspalathi]CAE6768752.1 hypothetical protein R69619_03742 [Paraburkholderia nemoris]
MDNFKFIIPDVHVEAVTLTDALKSANVNITVRHEHGKQEPSVIFSLKIGKHNGKWLFRYNAANRALSCSGGATSTFFGHNLWVFRNEAPQMRAIASMVMAVLSQLDGLSIASSPEDIIPDRVELTSHFPLSDVTHNEAIQRIDAMLKRRFGKSRFRNGDAHDEAGVTGIGATKNERWLRVYNPLWKGGKKPPHIGQEAWNELVAFCARHLRVEIILRERDIKRLDLIQVSAWEDRDHIDEILRGKLSHAGLTVPFTSASAGLTPSDVKCTNPAFVDAARHFFTNAERGSPIDKRNGSANRFRQFMLARGYDINIPFSDHHLLAHGLHEMLQLERRATLPSILRIDQELFGHWWI